MLGQMLPRLGSPAPPTPGTGGATGARCRSPMSSTGTTTSISNGLRTPASTMVTGRSAPASSWPPRKWAISSNGRWVADSPMRCGRALVISSSRSSESIRWAPRLVVAIAWISSMITVSTLTSVSRTFDVSIR